MDGAYACRRKGGLASCRAVECMPPSGRAWDSLDLSTLLLLGTQERVINTEKMASAWLALPAGGGARMHASTSDLCFFLLGFSGAPSHRSPLCARILYACSVITPVVKSFLASRCSAPGAGLIRAACTSRWMMCVIDGLLVVYVIISCLIYHLETKKLLNQTLLLEEQSTDQ